eukprot:5754795-Karenia_brevis.AAC.1
MAVVLPIKMAEELQDSDGEVDDLSDADSLYEELVAALETEALENELQELQAGAKVMTKGDLAAALAEEHGLSKAVCSKMLSSLAKIFH